MYLTIGIEITLINVAEELLFFNVGQPHVEVEGLPHQHLGPEYGRALLVSIR